MLYRLANMIWLAGMAVAVLCGIGAAMAFLMPHGDPGGGFLLVAIGMPAFLGAWAMRHIIVGSA